MFQIRPFVVIYIKAVFHFARFAKYRTRGTACG